MTVAQWNDLFQLNVTHDFVPCRQRVPALIARVHGLAEALGQGTLRANSVHR